jgi:ATP-binding cassette subfamily G (WHITE) protein 2 (PDR)
MTTGPGELTVAEYMATADCPAERTSQRPELGPVGTGSTDVDHTPLEKTTTNRTANERTIEPVTVDDRNELTKIASGIGRTEPIIGSRNSHGDGEHALERKDTLHGVKIGDPVLDPKSPEFDAYKWAKMIIKLSNEQNIIERRAGFLFKNLTVTGKGSALQLQQVCHPRSFLFQIVIII